MNSINYDGIPRVYSILIQDYEGERIFLKSYQGFNINSYKKFENNLCLKSKGCTILGEVDIISLGNFNAFLKASETCKLFVIAHKEENELLVSSLVECMYEGICSFNKGKMDKMSILNNMEMILLLFDEIIDSGYIMEINSNDAVAKAKMKAKPEPLIPPASTSSSSSSTFSSISALSSDLTLSQAFNIAKNQFFKNFKTSSTFSGSSSPPGTSGGGLSPK